MLFRSEGDEVVCLTEGVMKADIAYNFALGTSYESGFVGLTGVPSYSQFERALEELNSIGVEQINIMVDSDYTDTKRQADKKEQTIVKVGNRTINDAVDVYKRQLTFRVFSPSILLSSLRTTLSRSTRS